MAEMDDQKLEDLMRALGITPGATPTPPPAAPGKPEAPAPGAAPAPKPAAAPAPAPAAAERPAAFPSVEKPSAPAVKASIDLIKDVQLKMKIELGRARLAVQDILALTPGSVVELDKLTGDPLDIRVNDVLVARGEVLVINENFAIRVTEVVSPEARADDQLKR